jgi:hypothetical protein
MGKTLLLFISFCAIIFFNTHFNPSLKKDQPFKYSIVSATVDTSKKIDTAKRNAARRDSAARAAAKLAAKKAAEAKAAAVAKISNATKAAEAKAAADLAAKQAAAKAAADKKARESKITAFVNKLIKPLKFRSNEKKRITNLIHDYIANNSIAASPSIKDINGQLADIKTLIDAINKQYSADSVIAKYQQKDLKHTTDSLITLIKKEKPVILVKTDTPKKPVPQAAPAVKTTPPPPLTVSEQAQKKVNSVRELLAGPLSDITYSKKEDSVFVRKFSIKQSKEVMGFYADTSGRDIAPVNYKLITTLVYAINADQLPLSLGKNTRIIDSVQKYNLKLMFSFYTTQTNSTKLLLYNNATKEMLIKNSMVFLNQYKATSVNFDFGLLDASLRNPFSEFIYDVNAAYQLANKSFDISVTVPGSDKFDGYNLEYLDKFTRYFIMDFTKTPDQPGPMSTIARSSSSIDACLKANLAKEVLAKKFILCMPYFGLEWKNKTVNPIAYADIEKNYIDSIPVYNADFSAVRINANSRKGPLTIWYDDERTLGTKYDFVISNNLAGVAIKYLGDDGTKGELKNELIYKFAVIDTTLTYMGINSKKASLTDFIDHLFHSPCHRYVNPVYSKILLIANILIVIVMIVLGAVLFWGVKTNGDNWKPKIKLIYTLTGVFILWTLLFLLWLFFWEGNPFFGPNSMDCINISFATLFIILCFGTCVGIGSYWGYNMARASNSKKV